MDHPGLGDLQSPKSDPGSPLQPSPKRLKIECAESESGVSQASEMHWSLALSRILEPMMKGQRLRRELDIHTTCSGTGAPVIRMEALKLKGNHQTPTIIVCKKLVLERSMFLVLSLAFQSWGGPSLVGVS